MQVSLPADPEAPRTARAAIGRLADEAGFGGVRREELVLAVSEAVTNAVVHAYPQQDGQIHLYAALSGKDLTVLVSDDGTGMRQPTRRPGLGLGLMLMAGAADGFVISQRGEGGTEVQLRFSVAQ
jgi:anti-sigma regulatory factor (Ser/Thr protein kinase)